MRRYTEVVQLYFDAWPAQQRAVPISIDNTTQGKRVNQERQTMVSRIYVEKKPGFAAATPANTSVFAVEYLPGQFDQRADSVSECVQLVSAGACPDVRSAKVYVVEGPCTPAEVEAIKRYVINPVEAREASLAPKATLKMKTAAPASIERLDGFCKLDQAGLEDFISARGLAMDLADIQYCQRYFRGKRRDPMITELRVIDTYWSDHLAVPHAGSLLATLVGSGPEIGGHLRF
jgi:phosphoribosylformylglycinamidine synthase